MEEETTEAGNKGGGKQGRMEEGRMEERKNGNVGEKGLIQISGEYA